MFIFIIYAHMFLVSISSSGFSPGGNSKYRYGYDSKYEEYYYKDCPLLWWFNILGPFFLIILNFISLFVLEINILDIDDFFNFIAVVFTVIYTLVFMRLYSFILIKEIKNVSNYIIEKKPYFKSSALVFIYAISFLSSLTTIFYTNYFFDFSKSEEVFIQKQIDTGRKRKTEIKIKIKVHRGLYGIRYVGK